MRYRFIRGHRSLFSVKKMCRVLEVSPSGYYRWLRAPVSLRKRENARLKEEIRRIYAFHRGRAGSPMITADLHDKRAYAKVSRCRVARLMKQMGLRCRSIKKRPFTTASRHTRPVVPNHLDRNFEVSSPNRVWVSDITYMRIGESWHYLSIFLDLYSRKIVGWDISHSLEKGSVLRALRQSLQRRRPAEGLMIHSDRGIQYASRAFREILRDHGFIQSMSRKGNCWDNAVAESFFHTIKAQLIHPYRFRTVKEARRALFEYIEVYYNRKRKHSTNGYLSPADYERQWEEHYEKTA